MRLAFNASIVDPTLSGLGVYAVNLLRELAKLQDDLVVYTSCPEVCGLNSSKVRRVSPMLQPRRGRKGHFQRVAWAQTVLPLRLLADGASLFFSPLPEGMLFPTVRQVVAVHDLIPLYFPQAFPVQSRYFRYFLPAILKTSRAIVADSERSKRDLITLFGVDPRKIHVVPCGYDTSHYRPGVDGERVRAKYGLGAYILYVGNLLPHKNLPRLLDAFALVAPKCPHTLVIAGRKDPRYYPSLEADVRALGLTGRVSFLDYVPAEELPALYAAAAALVLPSLHEGFGLPLLEAMACGTPVVGANVASIPELLGDAGLLVDPRKPEVIAAAVLRLLTDEPLRKELITRGLARAARFSWDRTARQVLAVLEEVARA